MSISARLATTVSCHAWNADRSMLAICPNTPEVWIFTGCQDPDSNNWEKKWVLKEHDFVITGMDWCPRTNRLVTCAQDRNAFVWIFDAAAKLWKPQVVVLNINRAATDVKWSPDGTKFAVSSGAKIAMLCRYEEANDWWVSTPLKKHKSTVLSVCWHPNSKVLATVATDYRCRVLSAYLEDVDASEDGGVFGPLPPAGEVLHEFDVTRAWVNHAAWSPSGTQLAFVGHDSLLHVATFNADPTVAPLIQTIKCPTLPAMRVLFLSEDCLVTAGHSMNPELFARGAAASAGAGAGAAAPAAPGGFAPWTFVGYVDRKAEASSAAASKIANSFASARGMFASKVTTGGGAGGGAGGAGGSAANGSADGGSDSWTKHKNAITYMQPCRISAKGSVASFSTSGNDGRVVVWPIAELALPGVDLRALGVA